MWRRLLSSYFQTTTTTAFKRQWGGRKILFKRFKTKIGSRHVAGGITAKATRCESDPRFHAVPHQEKKKTKTEKKRREWQLNKEKTWEDWGFSRSSIKIKIFSPSQIKIILYIYFSLRGTYFFFWWLFPCHWPQTFFSIIINNIVEYLDFPYQ